MGLIALLFAYHGASGDAEPHASIRVGGVRLIERQIRQARSAGAERVLILAERMPPGLAAGLDEARRRDSAVEVVRAPSSLVGQIAPTDRVLVLDEGLVIDERAIEAVLAEDGESVISTWPAGAAPAGAERLDSTTFAAGLAVYPGRLVREVAANLGEWDLQGTLLRAAETESSGRRFSLAQIDDYAPARRRRVPLTWAKLTDSGSADSVTDTLLAASQKGCLDWPARFIHPPVENALVRLLLPTKVTPNMVTVGVILLGLIAALAFTKGWLWLGLLLALVTGPLDGVDGKLARTKLEFSRWGDLEHVADKVIEYLWYLCLASYFSSEQASDGPWAVAALIILFALAEAVQGEFFRRFTGAQLDDASEFERRFRLVSGRRNTFFWTLLPFAIFGAWYAGFVMIAVYSVVTFFVMQVRFYLQLQRYGRAHSPTIDANFRRTAYGFLPGGKGSGS